MGKGAGADGGTVISEGKIEDISKNPQSVIGPFLSDQYEARIRPVLQTASMFEKGAIHLETGEIHTVHPLDVRIPMGRLTVVTGVSGSGKTTMVLESLIPALKAKIGGQRLPSHVKNIEAAGITQVKRSTRRRSVSMSDRLLLLTPMSTTNSEKFTQKQKTQRNTPSRPEISLIIRENSVA